MVTLRPVNLGAPSPTPDATTASSRVDPATGVLITSNTATVNAPANFKKSPLLVSFGASVNGPDARYNLGLNDQEIPLESESLDYVSKLSQAASVHKPPLERQPDTTVAGRPAHHLAGPDSIFGHWTEEFGFRHEGHTIDVTVSTPVDLPQDQRNAIAALIPASVKLIG
ncbi:MAG: hypothetical protein H7270_02065 [Dermatophilaceae bacterium]|nr:hypothetical protein [Dermatophilaceae bacterium]